MAKKTKKLKTPPIDGVLSRDNIKMIRRVNRQAWGWGSYSRKLVIKRCTDKDGFGKCEKCKRKCPKVAVDHITPVGDVRAPDFLQKLWCHSSKLQGLCKPCHDKKTYRERQADRLLMKLLERFEWSRFTRMTSHKNKKAAKADF